MTKVIGQKEDGPKEYCKEDEEQKIPRCTGLSEFEGEEEKQPVKSDGSELLFASLVERFSVERAIDWLRIKFPSFSTSCTTTLALQFIMYTIATKVIMYKENKKIELSTL